MFHKRATIAEPWAVVYGAGDTESVCMNFGFFARRDEAYDRMLDETEAEVDAGAALVADLDWGRTMKQKSGAPYYYRVANLFEEQWEPTVLEIYSYKIRRIKK